MKKRILTALLITTSIFLLAACGKEEEPVAEVVIIPTNTSIPPTEIPKMQPGEPPPQYERTLEDADSSIKASEKRAVTGDNYLNSLYERPFTQQEMEYQPDLNILTVSIVSDEVFYYFAMTLDDVDPLSGTLTGTYGIEFDRTETGRGDLLVMVSHPAAEWSMENLTVYVDENVTVGGVKPIVAEVGYEENGYTSTVPLEGETVAWVRLAPEDPTTIQFAISRVLLSDPDEFLWGGWADGGVNDPTLFDYNDHFGMSEAGSPILGEDYPVKAIYSLDNTCRLPYGVAELFNVPGMCLSIPVPEEHQVVCVCVRRCLTRVGCCEWSCE